jgi:hypothetical protein
MDGRAGLCDSCHFCRVVENRRGSRFHLCRLSDADPAFPKYPPLPVLACSGYDPLSSHEDAGELSRPGERSRRNE